MALPTLPHTTFSPPNPLYPSTRRHCPRYPNTLSSPQGAVIRGGWDGISDALGAGKGPADGSDADYDDQDGGAGAGADDAQAGAGQGARRDQQQQQQQKGAAGSGGVNFLHHTAHHSVSAWRVLCVWLRGMVIRSRSQTTELQNPKRG